MFQSAYQDGDCVEVFSPAGKNPGSEWKSSGKVVRVYEKGVKGYVLTVSGGATSKMQLPKAPKGLLGLRQRHLVLQVLTAASQDKPFSLELGLKDSGGTRRRLVLSSSFKALHCTPLHAQVPLVGLDRHRGTWVNLSIDLAGLTAVCFRADAFSSLELISIGPTCRLRKIFTMKGGLDESEDGLEDQDDPAPGPKDSGACAPAPVAPVPVRMAFPAGVVPSPRNWVISLSALRRLASRDVPPPSPSKRASSVAASLGKTRKSRPVPSTPQSSFSHGPPSLPSSTASLCMSGEERSVWSSGGGAKAEKGMAPLRLLEVVAGKPSSSSSSRASPTGLLRRQRSISSRGSSSASTRAPATPSPLATPRRKSSNTPGRRDSRPPSSSSGILGPSTPGVGIARGGVGVGLAGREGGGTAPSGRSGTAGTPSFRRTPPRAAAVTPGSADRNVDAAAELSYGEMGGSGGREGVLPARRRAAEAYLSGGITNKMGQTRIADGSGGGASDRSGQANRAPAEEWQVAGSWSRGNDGHAPAWSFLEGNENDGFSPDDVSRMATPKPKRSYSMESPLGSPRAELATTAPTTSCDRPALASIKSGDTHRTASALGSDDQGGGRLAAEPSPSTLQASHAALPTEIDVSWREKQYDDDGGAVAPAKLFSSTVRLRSPGTRSDAKRASPCVSPLCYTIPSNTAADTPTALGASGRSSRTETTLEREEDGVRAKTPATAAHLFASTFSTLGGEGRQAARRSPEALDGGASCVGGRSPMSSRVGVLQNLLVPVGIDEQDLTRPNPGVVASAAAKRSTGDEAVLAKETAKLAPEEKGGGSGSVAVECGENVDIAERLLGRSSGNGSRNTNAVSSFVGPIARHEHPGVSNKGNVHPQAEATECLQPPETIKNDLRLTRTRAARSGVDASASALDRGPQRKAPPLGPTDELDEMARIQFDGFKGLLRPSSCSVKNEERWDEQKAGPRRTMGERSDELKELERKEIALLDLEESSNSEFGSVDLSQSPEKRAPFTGNYSPARASAVAENLQADSSTTKILGSSSSSGHGRPNGSTASPFESLDYRQRESIGDASNDDGDTDSVVLGSRASTASVAPGEGAVEEEPGARAGSAAEGEERVKRETRDRGGGLQHDSDGGSSQLYFDPVLNCYYDRVADKYYGLR